MPAPSAPPSRLDALRLELAAGPRLDAIEVASGGVRYAGRGGECDIRLDHEYVSRRHCSFVGRNGMWFVTDERSRHGTYLDESRLKPNDPTPLREGQTLRIEPWTFIVRLHGRPDATLAMADDSQQDAERVEVLSAHDRVPIAQRRLDVLIQCAGSLATVTDERGLAECIVCAALFGTGFGRGAMLRAAPGGAGMPEAGEVSIVHGIGLGRDSHGTAVSRSLLRAAAQGEIAILTTADTTPLGTESVVRLGIHSALCAPIHVGPLLFGFLYLDSRSNEARTEREAATFCQALARMCGLALATIRGREAESQQRQLESELVAAREAQRFIMPPNEGRIGLLSYAVRMKPGRFVAGDLFDVVPLADGCVAFFLGDVTGKGIAAGILMATTQTYLNVTLQHQGDPAAVLGIVNRHLVQHSAHNVFVSLWLGVFDPRKGEVRFVDAGHGHWLHRSGGGEPAKVQCAGGILLGIDADFAYVTESLPFAPGSRVILFSDGAVEQIGLTGEMFGMQRTIAALGPAQDAAGDVESLFDAVEQFAAGASLADDTTVASIELMRA
jgi:phosphoserine phosphatase RsbU/P